MTLAALWSPSWTAPHDGHIQVRICNGSSSSRCPHAEHVLLDASQRDTEFSVRPVSFGLLANDPHELPPPRIADRSCQPAISEHAHDVEVLDVGHLVLANQRQSQPCGPAACLSMSRRSSATPDANR